MAPQGSGLPGGPVPGSLPLRPQPLDRAGTPVQLKDPRAALAWFGAALAYVLTAGTLWLIEPTDARYAEIAREMASGGDWLVPHWNGLVHLQKPPLAYWIGAAGLRLFGTGPAAARAGVILAAALTFTFVLRLGRLTSPAAAKERGDGLAVWIAASSLLVFALFHVGATDPYLAASVAGFHAVALDPKRRGGALPWLALAAGFLAKGPIVFVLTLVPVGLAAGWSGRGESARWMTRGRGWLVFAAVALPWYLVVLARTPGLFDYFLRHELWERYATTVHHRSGPFWYFVPILLAGALPWTGAALVGGFEAARRARSERDFASAALVTWVAFPFLVFSTSGSKLPAYLLPCFPAVALLAARVLPERKSARFVSAALAATLAIALEIVGPRFFPERLPLWVHASAAAFLVAALLLAIRRPRGGAVLALVALVLTWPSLAAREEDLGAPRALAETLARERHPGEPVVEMERIVSSVPFVLREPVLLFEVPRESSLPDAAWQRVSLDSTRLSRLARPLWIVGSETTVRERIQAMGWAGEIRARWRAGVLFRVAGTPASRSP